MKLQFFEQKSLNSFPREIRISLFLLKFLWLFGLGSFLVLLPTILIRYNTISSTTVIIMASLLLLFSTYYILSQELKKKKQNAFLFLIITGIINFILSLIGLFFIFLIAGSTYTYSNELKNSIPFHSLQTIIGLVIISTISLLPAISAVLAIFKKKFFTVKTSIVSSLIITLLAVPIAIINTFWLGYFSYLLLVLLFPNIFGLNT